MKEMLGGCCVCSDERGWAENPLVYCDGQGCNVAVHQACYGIVHVPKGPWYCRKCESQERSARVKCELCPQRDGALKRTDTGVAWCHVVCALFIPEAWFANVQTMEPIVLKNVPPERFNKVCYICEENGRATRSNSGACMQCNRNGCKMNFHVTCAQAQGLLCEEAGNYGDNVKYCGYCVHHYKKLKRDANIKQIPAFKPIPADNASPEKGNTLTTDTRMFKRGNKAENKESYNPAQNQLLGGQDKEKQPATPPLSNASSGIGTSTLSETSTISPTESPNQEEEDSENRSFPMSQPSLNDNHALHRSVSSGSLYSVQSADLRLASEAGPMFSPSAGLSGETLSGSFTGSLDSFMTGSTNKISSLGRTASQSDNEIDQAAKRSRSKSQEKFEKKMKRTKQPNTLGNKKLSRNGSTESKDTSPTGSRKVRRKPELTTPSIGTNSNNVSLNSFSVFGGSPHFQSIGVPGPLTFSFTQNNSGSGLGSCNDLTEGACGPPKIFPSQQSPQKEPPNGEFPTSLEQLLERQWEQGSQFLMKQGEHFDIASLLHCLHQLKSENHRLEGHIKSLATRRDHLLAVNARLSIPFSSPLHPDSFLSSDKPTDGKTVEPSLMQDVACLTADNPVQAGGSTTVPAVTCVSSLPPMTSVLNLSVSNTLSAIDSTPTSMEVTLPSSSTPDKSKPDVT